MLTKDNLLQSCRVIFDITFRQTILGKKTVLMLILAFLPVLIAIYYRLSGRASVISPEQALSHIMVFFLLFLSILVALFYGTAIVADEIDNKTIPYIFTRPVRKYLIVIGKFAAYFLGAFLVLIPPMLITFLLIATDGRMSTDFALSLCLFSKQFCVIIASLIVYGAIFTFFGARLRFPVVFGLMLAFGWEKITLLVPGIVRKFSVAHYLLSAFPKDPAMQKLIDEMSQGATSGTVPSIIVLSAITIVFLGLAVLTIYRREYRFE